MPKLLLALCICCLSSCVYLSDLEKTKQVTVYTFRETPQDSILYNEFKKLTGINVNVVVGKADEFVHRIAVEGDECEADVLFLDDISRMEKAKDREIVQATDSPILNKNIPNAFRDSEKFWYALTKSPKVIAYSTERVNADQLSTYEDLGDKKWRGKIYTRSAIDVNNQNLLASIILSSNEEKGIKWANKLLKNCARFPRGNDKVQISFVATGKGDLALVNAAALGEMIASEVVEEREEAKKVNVFFPNQQDRGANINISGMMMVNNCPNPIHAKKLMEFLSEVKNQEVLAKHSYEFPISKFAKIPPPMRDWGNFKEDTTSILMLQRLRGKAVSAFETAGWK